MAFLVWPGSVETPRVDSDLVERSEVTVRSELTRSDHVLLVVRSDTASVLQGENTETLHSQARPGQTGPDHSPCLHTYLVSGCMYI